MTEVAIVADAPGGPTPLAAVTEADPAALYRAMLADVLNTCERSGADVLVNVGPPDTAEAVSAMEALVAAEALEPDAVRIEPQVGADHGARVHATVDHLLATSDHRTVAVVYPEVPMRCASNPRSARTTVRGSTPPWTICSRPATTVPSPSSIRRSRWCVGR